MVKDAVIRYVYVYYELASQIIHQLQHIEICLLDLDTQCWLLLDRMHLLQTLVLLHQLPLKFHLDTNGCGHVVQAPATSVDMTTRFQRSETLQRGGLFLRESTVLHSFNLILVFQVS